MTESTMYDSVNWQEIPTDALYIAFYGNGKYAADRKAVEAKYPKARCMSIDVIGNDYSAGILDVERYDATPGAVPGWVAGRLEAHPDGALCRVYMNLTTWPEVRKNVSNLSPYQRSFVRYFVADWTGRPHLVPGSDATQYENTSNWDASLIIVERFADA
jgi:hypothetical protein